MWIIKRFECSGDTEKSCDTHTHNHRAVGGGRWRAGENWAASSESERCAAYIEFDRIHSISCGLRAQSVHSAHCNSICTDKMYITIVIIICTQKIVVRQHVLMGIYRYGLWMFRTPDVISRTGGCAQLVNGQLFRFMLAIGTWRLCAPQQWDSHSHRDAWSSNGPISTGAGRLARSEIENLIISRWQWCASNLSRIY